MKASEALSSTVDREDPVMPRDVDRNNRLKGKKFTDEDLMVMNREGKGAYLSLISRAIALS